MRTLLLLGAVLGGLTSCQQRDGSHASSTTTRTGSSARTSVAGRDADQNGIRDDIDALLRETLAAATTRRPAATYARQLQTNLTAVNPTPDHAADLVRAQLRTATCLKFALGAADTHSTSRLFANTVNTKERRAAMQRLSDEAGITSFTLPKRADCVP